MEEKLGTRERRPGTETICACLTFLANFHKISGKEAAQEY